jgi:hypothetical protein
MVRGMRGHAVALACCCYGALMPHTGGQMSFLATGDWGGVPWAPYYSQVQLDNANAMAGLAASLEPAARPPRLALLMGDNFYTTGVESVSSPRFKHTFEDVFSQPIFRALPFYTILGNHDHCRLILPSSSPPPCFSVRLGCCVRTLAAVELRVKLCWLPVPVPVRMCVCVPLPDGNSKAQWEYARSRQAGSTGRWRMPAPGPHDLYYRLSESFIPVVNPGGGAWGDDEHMMGHAAASNVSVDTFMLDTVQWAGLGCEAHSLKLPAAGWAALLLSLLLLVGGVVMCCAAAPGLAGCCSCVRQRAFGEQDKLPGAQRSRPSYLGPCHACACATGRGRRRRLPRWGGALLSQLNQLARTPLRAGMLALALALLLLIGAAHEGMDGVRMDGRRQYRSCPETDARISDSWRRGVDGARQAAWLERELNASRADWKIVVGHYPVYSIGAHGPNQQLIDELRPLLERHGVAFYLCGASERAWALPPLGPPPPPPPPSLPPSLPPSRACPRPSSTAALSVIRPIIMGFPSYLTALNWAGAGHDHNGQHLQERGSAVE